MRPMPVLERFEIRFSGLGGQGILTLGRLLGAALALGQDYQVTQTQSYGPEARGGASRADLVVSSGAISYPLTVSLDLLVALSQEACNRYHRELKDTGLLLTDTLLVKKPPACFSLGLPFSTLAAERLGNPLLMNSLVLGAVSHLLPFAVPLEIRKAIGEALPATSVPGNRKAFDLGLREAKKSFGPTPTIWQQAEEHAGRRRDTEIFE